MLEAVIWDMDGVLVDTGPFHYEAWRQLAIEVGQVYTADDFRRTFGMRSPDIIRSTFAGSLTSVEVNALSDRKEVLFRQLVRGRIQPLPGALDLLRLLDAAGYPQALASSAPLANVKLVLDSLGITDLFKARVTDKDVLVGKPDPQVFLVAARRLGVHPEGCLVVEDAVPGVQAAKAGGMMCLAVASSHRSPGLEQADLVVSTLETVDLATVTSLFHSPYRPP